jgi:hypothetical protein
VSIAIAIAIAATASDRTTFPRFMHYLIANVSGTDPAQIKEQVRVRRASCLAMRGIVIIDTPCVAHSCQYSHAWSTRR